jgi:ketosteroid isomerase-like protein
VSAENVEIVRALYEAFAQRDNEYPFTVYDEEIVLDQRRSPIPDAQEVYHGHDGVRRFWREWLAAWDEIEFELGELVGAGEQVVGFTNNQRMHARATGIWLDMPPYAQIWTLSGGKVVRIEYRPADEARRAFGLEAGGE